MNRNICCMAVCLLCGECTFSTASLAVKLRAASEGAPDVMVLLATFLAPTTATRRATEKDMMIFYVMCKCLDVYWILQRPGPATWIFGEMLDRGKQNQSVNRKMENGKVKREIGKKWWQKKKFRREGTWNVEDRHVGRHDFCVRTSVHSGYVMFCDPLMMENKSWSKTSRHLNFLLL